MGVKISQLTSKTGKLASTDLLAIAEVSGATYVSKKISGANLMEISLDTSPQLGADLDVNGNKIISNSNGYIELDPDGTGVVQINSDLFLKERTGSIAKQLRFYEGYVTGANYIAIKAPDSLSVSTTYILPSADGSNGQFLQTDGSGNLQWQNPTGSLMPAQTAHEVYRGVNYVNNSTTETTSGGVTISTTGSVIARAVASTSYATKQIRKGFYASVVSAGRYTGTRGSALLWYIGGGWRYVCEVYISDSAYGAGCRQFYGMMGQTTDLTYSDVTTVESMLNVIGIGSDASDTNLQVFHNDGSGTCTKVDLGVNFPANRTAGAALTTTYSIELYNANGNNTDVIYKITNNETGATTEGTLSTNLPLHTQGLNFTASRCMGTSITNTGQFDLTMLGVYSL